MDQNVARWKNIGSIDLERAPVPTLKEGEILIKVAASGICGTDLHIARGETPHAAKEVIIGHEFAGYVEKLHETTKTKLKVGDLVAIDPNMPCHCCSFCRNKKYHLCASLRCIGVTIHGGMSNFVAVPAEAAVPVPSHVPPQVASLAEPLSCVVHAVDTGHVKSGDSVLVIGAGPIGLMVIGLCSLSGARVTAVEPNDVRRESAKSTFGAAEVLKEPPPLGEPTLGDGFDVVFECVGRADTMETAVAQAKAGATVVWVGVAKTDARVEVSPFIVYRHELTIRSTYTNPFGMDRAVKILADNKLSWDKLISHTFSLDEFDQAWALFLANKAMKICITP